MSFTMNLLCSFLLTLFKSSQSEYCPSNLGQYSSNSHKPLKKIKLTTCSHPVTCLDLVICELKEYYVVYDTECPNESKYQ